MLMKFDALNFEGGGRIFLCLLRNKRRAYVKSEGITIPRDVGRAVDREAMEKIVCSERVDRAGDGIHR